MVNGYEYCASNAWFYESIEGYSSRRIYYVTVTKTKTQNNKKHMSDSILV